MGNLGSTTLMPKNVETVRRVEKCGSKDIVFILETGDKVELLLDGLSFSTPKVLELTSGDITKGYVDLTVLGPDLGADGVKSLTARLVDISGNAGTASLLTSGAAVNLSAVSSIVGSNGFTVTNSGGATTLTGSAFADTLQGSSAAETIAGGGGDDTISGGGGADLLRGGDGRVDARRGRRAQAQAPQAEASSHGLNPRWQIRLTPLPDWVCPPR
jgi:hypothetical protein